MARGMANGHAGMPDSPPEADARDRGAIGNLRARLEILPSSYSPRCVPQRLLRDAFGGPSLDGSHQVAHAAGQRRTVPGHAGSTPTWPCI